MIAIINYNAGNTRSVQNAVSRLGYECIVTDDEQLIREAEKVILPGVGEASSAMKHLRKNNLHLLIPGLTQPVLGICLGLQLMCNHSEENDTEGMGIFNVAVKKFPAINIVPHMGWNNLEKTKTSLFQSIGNEDNVYFVHSYYGETSADTIAVCDYILPFSAALNKNNFYATQFHPEKSGAIGEIILQNFLNI